ncbi:hypothetical protein JCM8547_003886 [Rhodosporidiobolus lusitaniae]
MPNPPAVVVVIGASGCGKSTVGQQLADVFASPFIDADDLHPVENVEKMAAGVPLEDEDRLPWLLTVRQTALRLASAQSPANDQSGLCFVACSALKRSYRDLLRGETESEDQEEGFEESSKLDERARVFFIYLHGSPSLLLNRLTLRLSHFMRATMLDSQLAVLEPPNAGEEEGVVAIKLGEGEGETVEREREAVAEEARRRVEEWLEGNVGGEK